MSPRVWAEIAAAHEDTSRQIAAAFADRGRLPDLPPLRARLRRRLDDLLAALSPPLTPDDAVSVLVPLVFLLDEQVEGRIARAGGDGPSAWPKLQRDLFPDGDGGDAFYERAGALLRLPDPPALPVAAYLFCLNAGFQGRLVDDPGAIPGWKARLAACLPAASAASAPLPATLRRARPRVFYVLAVLGALVVAQIVLLALARSM
jgi:type VI protein secretion system component VasF